MYYTKLENGETYIKGSEVNLQKLGTNIRLLPNLSNSRETHLGLGLIYREPKDDGSVNPECPVSPSISESSMERELYQSYERERERVRERERERERERVREMFYLTRHSTHFIYGYMASDIWLRTILIVRKETRCRHIGYSYRLYMHHPTGRITHTTTFVTPVVEHWLEREIAQWVHPMKDRSDYS